jgi:hypothetical protein
MLDHDISEEEIFIAVKNLNNGKAPGEDDIINKYINSTVNQFLPIYVNFFQADLQLWDNTRCMACRDYKSNL